MKLLYQTDQYSQQRQREKPVWVYPVLMAMEATHMRDLGNEVHWASNIINGSGDKDPIAYGLARYYYDEIITQPQGIDFLSLPIPDRVWTMAHSKRYQLYGNYKYLPATHMQVANGCWHGKCTFCVENGRRYQVRNIESCMSEIWDCLDLGFKEVFDDSGTFPDGKWLEYFCKIKSENKRLNRMVMGCNMRIGADADFKLMKEANFRMVLFGIESANQSTLDRIQKGIRADDIIPTIKRAADAGLSPHIAVMFGQEGESEEEELRTLDLVHYLLRKGYAKTAQASLCRVRGNEPIDRGNVKRIYNVAKYGEFWFNQIKEIRSASDIKYLFKGIKSSFRSNKRTG